MSVNVKLLKQLKDETSASLSVCKKALIETNNNYEEAKLEVFKRNIIKSEKISGKDTEISTLFTYNSSSNILIAKVGAQTDFVLNTDELSNLFNGILKQSVDCKTKEDVMTKYSKDINNLSGKVGENITIEEFYNIKIQEHDGIYAHNVNGLTKQVSMILCDCENSQNKPEIKKLLDELAVHIMMEEPKYLTEDKLDSQFLEDEKKKFFEEKEEVLNKKPLDVQERMWEGKKNSLLSEFIMMNQRLDGDKNNDLVKDYIEKFEKKHSCRLILKSFFNIK